MSDPKEDKHRPSIVFLDGAERPSGLQESLAPKLHPLTGRFADASLEREFLADDLAHGTRAFLRFAVPLAALAFVVYGAHDVVVVPAHSTIALAIRYGVFVPTATIVLGVVFSRDLLLRWHQEAMLFFGLSLNAAVLWIGAIAQGAGFFIYTSFAILFVTLGPFIGRLRVTSQLAYTILTVLLYDVLDALVSHSAAAVVASMNLTFVSMGAIGALSARQMEIHAREGFLQRRVIRAQVEDLKVQRERADGLLANILPDAIARLLKTDRRAIAEGFTDATVGFADIVGFTKMSARLTPEELVRRLNQIFSAFDDMVDELGLEKIKTIGDAYMVAGGLHDRHAGDHPQAVADFALRMQGFVKEYGAKIGEPLSIRVGLHTGPVVAGVIGKRKFIYDVWGDTVNTASRMESHSLPGEIQVSEDAYVRLAKDFALEDRGEIDVKGKGMMHVWFLRARRQADVEAARAAGTRADPR
jgi:class 3 adenylate cyclase